ncbi:hypothetical protein RhiXN_07110 [Rhizoctonia solani]|uniref:DUF659 domain-containing protein n=1 Tax=Rhizoctonia solani TaxID=456999 RepID=A0A8H8P7A1_9AGAM|nr:uncharacterized protein RhiXN_10422 [Rhizoctonia solani]XP_043185398.1 uncharacterized protein RhiXN_07110 [Rhizoctonia solani]QRW24098.1 hypothetical protein RhiXN_10422 [Rhizoctonia solani]QRW25161.1 hypothetical protein RhiXN_07110 [Rhizoctonia solani]
MSDGWKNIKRNALIASMLSVDYKTYTVQVHNLSAQHKTANNHLKLVLNDIDSAEKEHNVRIIAWVSDAGGNSRAMQVRLHCLRPHILVFDCWAHQINLIVGDIMGLTSRLVDTADAAIDIINLLSESQSLCAIAARNPEEFWASAGRSPETIEQANTVLKNIDDPEFWHRLGKLKLYLEPLAIAANVSQAATTRLDHILVELGRLYYTFSHLGFNPKQLFSEMGHIHTKRRNQLGYQKVFDTAVVRMDLKRKHADEGQTRSRLKRQFGSPALDSVISRANNQPDKLAESIADVDITEEGLATSSVRSLAMQLRQDVLNDKDPLDNEFKDSCTTNSTPPTNTLPKKSPISLRDLFDYSRSTGSKAHGLDVFKSNGLDNLKAELELYGLVTRDVQQTLQIDDSAA